MPQAGAKLQAERGREMPDCLLPAWAAGLPGQCPGHRTCPPPAPPAGVCLSLFGLQDLLSWFGFDDAFCEEFDGQASPAGSSSGSVAQSTAGRVVGSRPGLLLHAVPAMSAAAA